MAPFCWRNLVVTAAWCTLLSASPACAQEGERPDRLLNLNAFFGPDLYWAGSSGRLTIYPPRISRSVGKALPQLLAGGFAFVGARNAPHLVVCGRDPDADEGFVRLFVWDDAAADYVTPATGGTYREAGSDFVGVDGDAAGRIHLLDAKKARIISGPFPEAGSLPSSWSTTLSSAEVPQLADAADKFLRVTSKPSGETAFILPVYRAEDSNLVIHVSPQGVRVVDPDRDRKRAYLDSSSIAAHQEDVRIKGPASTVVTLLDVTDLDQVVAVAEGLTDATGIAQLAVAPPGLRLGQVYAVRSAALGTFDAPFRSPAILIGQADDLEPGTAIRPLDSRDAVRSFVGNPHFSISVSLDPIGLRHTLAVPASYDAMLNVGTGDDVVTLPDGRPYLQSEVSIAATAQIWNERRPGFGVVDLPIPDEPDLVGGVVHYQWVVLVDGEPRLSNIVGYIVRSERWVPPGSEAFFGRDPGHEVSEGRTQETSLAESEEFASALSSWLESAQIERVPDSVRRTVHHRLGLQR